MEKTIKVTARDLIRNAMRRVNIIGVDDEVTYDEASSALQLLNETLDSFNNENALFSYTKEINIDLNGSAKYILEDRPADGIRSAFFASDTDYTREVKIVTVDEFQLVNRDNFNSVQSNVSHIWYNGTFPFSELYVYPQSSVGTLKLIVSGSFEFFSDLDEEIYLPNGFIRGLTYNLAVLLCAEYGRDVPEVIAGKAVSDKALIKDSAKKQVKYRMKLDWR